MSRAVATAQPVPSASAGPLSEPAPPVPSPGVALAAGAAKPLAGSVPVRLLIPAIGVDSTLMELGLHDDGTMEVPPAGFPAGWYSGAPTPGELGPAVIAGHVDWTGPGVFYDLHKLAAGDIAHAGLRLITCGGSFNLDPPVGPVSRAGRDTRMSS